MKVPRALVVVAVAVVALTGCQGVTTESPLDTPTLSSEPTPSATQARETGLVAPARPFGGDCGVLMTDAEATSILGTPAVLRSGNAETFAPEVAVELHGGLRCHWVPEDGSFSSSVSVVLLPAGAVSYEAPSGCRPADEEVMGPRCVVEAIVNGTRVSGGVYIDSEPIENVSAATAAFLALFDERASAANPAPTPIPAIGAWAHPVDCAAVVATGDVSAVPGLGSAAVGTRFPFGGHDYAAPAADALERGSAEFPYCWIDGEAADLTFVAMGGGRWLESTVAAAGTPFAIEGYESAYVSPGQEGLTKVDIFHGPNWLHFQIAHTSNAKALADALFAGLNATAAT